MKQMEKQYEREHLAELLESLAAELRKGSVEIDGQVFHAPQLVETRIKVAERKGTVRFHLKWGWSTLRDYSESERKKVEQWRASFNELKKALSHTFDELCDAVNRNVLPGAQTVKEFLDQCNAFAAMADPDWRDAVKEFLDHAENLFRTVEKGDRQAISHELDDLRRRMTGCHFDAW